MHTLHNETQTVLQEAKHELKDAIARGADSVEDKITEGKDETKDSVAALR